MVRPLLLSLLVAAPLSAQLRIQEVVYDGVGTDGDEVFTELAGPAGMSLDGWSLVGINGGTGSAYRTIDLTGLVVPADGILVLATASAEAEVAAARDAEASVDWQNGPDAIQLLDAEGAVVDALQYGDAGLHNAGEGAPSALTAPGESLSRAQVGADTDDNAADFVTGAPTPGRAVFPVDAGATLSLPDTLGLPGQILALPLLITGNEGGLLAAEVGIAFDARVLTPVTLDPAPATKAWQVATHLQQGEDWIDTLRIALATDVDTLVGDTALLTVSFRVSDERRPAAATLRLTGVVLDDGLSPPALGDGRVDRIGRDALLDVDSSGFALPHLLRLAVSDPDEDRSMATDTVWVELSEGDSSETVALAEDPLLAGYFSGAVEVMHAAAVPGDGVLQVSPRQVASICYVDSLDATGTITRRCVERIARGHDASVQVSRVVQPGDTLWVRVSDRDLDRDPAQHEATTVMARTPLDSVALRLEAVHADGVFFDGWVRTRAPEDSTGLLLSPGSAVVIAYLDSAASDTALVTRVDCTLVVRRFGDADRSGHLQAFDANAILQHVIEPERSPVDSLAANLDEAAPGGDISPVDASLLLQQRVGMLERFPVQQRTSANHPGPDTPSPRSAVALPTAQLVTDGPDQLLWLADRSGVLAVDVEVRGLRALDVESVVPGFLAAHRAEGERWHVALAGARPVAGEGALLRFVGAAASGRSQLTRLRLNDQTVPTAAPSAPVVPSRWQLGALHPNPFNGATSARLMLQDPVRVEATVFNTLGQPVRRLADAALPPGEHLLRWDGRDESGRDAATGLYLLRVVAAGRRDTAPILLLR